MIVIAANVCPISLMEHHDQVSQKAIFFSFTSLLYLSSESNSGN